MLALLFACALSVNTADKAEVSARALFSKAEVAYNGGRFEEALDLYSKAFELKPLPGFLFNIAQCHKNLEHWERAEFFFSRYLALTPAEKADPRARALLDEAKQRAAQQRAEQQQRATQLKPAPPPEPVQPPPVVVAPAPVEPAPVVVVPAPEPPVERGRSRVVVWGSLGLGVGAGVAGAVLLGLAKQHSVMLTGGDGLGGQVSTAMFTAEQARAYLDEGLRMQTFGFVCLGAAVALLVFAAIWYAVGS